MLIHYREIDVAEEPSLATPVFPTDDKRDANLNFAFLRTPSSVDPIRPLSVSVEATHFGVIELQAINILASDHNRCCLNR